METKNLNLRLDDELFDLLRAAAQRDCRSLNGEVVWCLRQMLATETANTREADHRERERQ